MEDRTIHQTLEEVRVRRTDAVALAIRYYERAYPLFEKGSGPSTTPRPALDELLDTAERFALFIEGNQTEQGWLSPAHKERHAGEGGS